MTAQATDHRFYGRRKGHPLRAWSQMLVDSLLPKLRLTLPDAGPLDLGAVFPEPSRPLWLEIGFGRGEHLAAQAMAHPQVNFIGCEPFLNGVAGLLQEIDAKNLKNIRIFNEDARRLLPRLADASVDRLFLLYPDPWPKLRHHKRRFVSRENLDQIARALRPGGQFLFATDHRDYCAWTLREVLGHGAFSWTAEEPEDWRRPPAGWVATRYEQKALAAGGRAVYLSFQRRS